jgi:outer membrane protein assembly factor BamD (BamD/ComL family)
MKTGILTVAALLLALCSFSWAQKLLIDTSTAEGKTLSEITRQSDASRKRTMLEEFIKTYPNSSQAAWVYGQLQSIYLQEQQYDKVLETGEKALAGGAGDVDLAYNNLKAVEGKNDPDGVAKWSAETSRLARKVEQSTQPSDDDAKARIDYAKQVDTYSEYSIYAMVLKTTDPAKIVALVEPLEQRNPKSEYLSKSYGMYLNALRQTGQNDKAGAAAETEADRNPNNEDALLIAADYNMQRQNQDKALAYAAKLSEVMQAKTKPAELSDADWEKKKSTLLGAGYWMQGIVYSGQKKYSHADKALREALPLIKGDSQMLGVGLFHLGVADYELGKSTKKRALLQDALKFSQQSAAIKGPLQAQAQANVKAMGRQVGRR